MPSYNKARARSRSTIRQSKLLDPFTGNTFHPSTVLNVQSEHSLEYIEGTDEGLVDHGMIDRLCCTTDICVAKMYHKISTANLHYICDLWLRKSELSVYLSISLCDYLYSRRLNDRCSRSISVLGGGSPQITHEGNGLTYYISGQDFT
jgi:hypothetical protein